VYPTPTGCFRAIRSINAWEACFSHVARQRLPVAELEPKRNSGLSYSKAFFARVKRRGHIAGNIHLAKSALAPPRDAWVRRKPPSNGCRPDTCRPNPGPFPDRLAKISLGLAIIIIIKRWGLPSARKRCADGRAGVF